MADCIFCQIIKGQLPCAKVYEDGRVISFLDINPVNAGHTLVVPKTHYETLFDIPAEDLQACTLAAQKIARAVFKGTKAVGLNFSRTTSAGRTAHRPVHFHLILGIRKKFSHIRPASPINQGELERSQKNQANASRS